MLSYAIFFGNITYYKKCEHPYLLQRSVQAILDDQQRRIAFGASTEQADHVGMRHFLKQLVLGEQSQQLHRIGAGFQHLYRHGGNSWLIRQIGCVRFQNFTELSFAEGYVQNQISTGKFPLGVKLKVKSRVIDVAIENPKVFSFTHIDFEVDVIYPRIQR